MSLIAKIQYEQVIMTIISLIKMGAKRCIHKQNTHTNVDGNTNIYERSARWVITWNNCPDNWKEIIKSNEELMQNIKFFIGEVEFAPSTGTKHVQGYFRLNGKHYRSTIRKWFPGVFFDIAKGSELDNIKYCTKTKKDILQIGEAYSSARVSIEKESKTIEMLDDVLKMDINEFEAKWPYECFHHYQKLMAYKLRHQKQQNVWNGDLKMKNYWLWGPAGTGKSKWARKHAPLNRIFKKNLNKWWDGFDEGEWDIVVIDEMNESKAVLADQIKDWGDRYPFKGEVKGAAINIDPGTYIMIITANFSIEQCFSKQQDIDAIKRRFKEVYIKDNNDIFLNTILDLSILSK